MVPKSLSVLLDESRSDYGYATAMLRLCVAMPVAMWVAIQVAMPVAMLSLVTLVAVPSLLTYLSNPTLIIIKKSYKIVKILLSKKQNIDIVHFMTTRLMILKL